MEAVDSRSEDMDDVLSTKSNEDETSKKNEIEPIWLGVNFHSSMSKASATKSKGSNREMNQTSMDDELLSSHVDTVMDTVMDMIEWAGNSSGYSSPANTMMSTETTNPTTNVSTGTYDLVCAKNEVVGVQLRLHSNQNFVVSTDSANWFVPSGHVPRARVFTDLSILPNNLRVELIVLGSVLDENDNLIIEYFSHQNFTLEPSTNHCIYVRIRIPENMPVGTHEIPIFVCTQAAGFFDEEAGWSGKIRLQVVDVTMPSPQNWLFHLDLWQHLTSIARGHSVSLWSDEHFHLIDKYYSCLSQLGQKAVSIVVSEMPWAGQQCYLEGEYPSSLYEHSILEVYSSTPDGRGESKLSIDFSHFNRLLSIAKEYSMDKEIEIFGLMSVWMDSRFGFGSIVDGAYDFWRIRCYDYATKKFRYLRQLDEIKLFVRLVYEHFEEYNLLDYIRVCADEPGDIKLFHQQIDFMRKIAPGFKYKVAINHYEFMQYAPSEVIDYVPLLPLACSNIQITEGIKKNIEENGGRMSWYVCCSPNFPNNFVSSPLVEGRLMGWLTFFLKLDGFLRWNFCLWPSNPWHNLKWRSPSWRVGDMYFVLPGKSGHPVETLRYESLRLAIQDYELFKLAENQLSNKQMDELIADTKALILRTQDLSNFANADKPNCSPSDLYSLDPKDYQAARHILLEALAASSL